MINTPQNKNNIYRALATCGGRFAQVFAITFLLATCVIYFTSHEGRIAAVWPVNAFCVVFLINSSSRLKPGIVLGFSLGLFSANLIVGDPLLQALLLTGANTAEVLIVASLFTYGRQPRRISFAAIFKLLAAALAGSLASSAIAGTGLLISGATLRMQELAIWFAADMLGLLLFVPMLLSLRSPKSHLGHLRPDWKFGAMLVSLCALAFVVFAQSSYPILFLVPGTVVALSFTHGIRGAAYGMLAVTVISLPFALADSGPTSLMHTGMSAKILVLQAFLVVNSVLSLSVAGVVSDRTRLIRRLARSEQWLKQRAQANRQHIAEARLAERMSGVGHWSFDPSSSEVYWSPQVYDIHGVTPATFSPIYDDAIQFYVPEDRDMVRNFVSRAIETGEGWDFEATLIAADGRRRRVRSIGECLRSPEGDTQTIFGVFKDITEERRVYEDLAEREKQYRLLAEHSTDIVLQFDLDGTVTFVSPSCRMLGLNPESTVGRNAIDFVIPEDRPHAARAIADVLKGTLPDGSAMPEHRARTADGGFIWLEGSPTLIRDDSGRPISIISSYRNVTDRREREDALAAARREAEAATRAKTEFLSNMSHEIRTPLNGILGFAKLAAETDLTAEQRDYVGSIQRAGKMLREIVDDILDFSKVEAGKIELDVQPFDIREAVRDVTALVEAGRTRKTAALSWTIAGLENTRILADEIRVRQVLLNLVGNAAKFTETGSITLSVSQSGEDIVFQISDTGRGIPRDKLAQVFEGFRQADATITRQYGGSGLGLSISRSLTRLMGGELELESVEGEGTVVTVRIPYKPAGEPVAQRSADIAQQAEEHTSDGARIMVVDDVDMNLSLIRHGLKYSGHVLETFSSPRAAFERLAAGEAFDIIFMDVQMPDLDGLTLTRMIRALDGPASHTPIIALTAHTLPAHIQECLDAGMTGHLSKPVDLDRMKAMISGALAAGRQAEPAELPAPDPIAALRAEYRGYLGTISKEFDDILKKTEDQEATRAIEFLAHAIAGTAANFGFGAVSSAAFELEANARRQLKTGAQDRQSLTAQVARLVETGARAAAA